jgi:DNA-binding IclR family transcriptional regulator
LTTSEISKILEILSDGQWHLLEEIQQKTELDKDKTRQVMVFLKKYSFIVLDEAKKRIRLEETVRNFLTQTATP